MGELPKLAVCVKPVTLERSDSKMRFRGANLEVLASPQLLIRKMAVFAGLDGLKRSQVHE